jgi:hypothetical protein
MEINAIGHVESSQNYSETKRRQTLLCVDVRVAAFRRVVSFRRASAWFESKLGLVKKADQKGRAKGNQCFKNYADAPQCSPAIVMFGDIHLR